MVNLKQWEHDVNKKCNSMMEWALNLNEGGDEKKTEDPDRNKEPKQEIDVTGWRFYVLLLLIALLILSVGFGVGYEVGSDICVKHYTAILDTMKPIF